MYYQLVTNLAVSGTHLNSSKYRSLLPNDLQWEELFRAPRACFDAILNSARGIVSIDPRYAPKEVRRTDCVFPNDLIYHRRRNISSVDWSDIVMLDTGD